MIKFLSFKFDFKFSYINPILHEGGHFVPAHVDNPSWILSGSSNWAHISWLCSFQHFIGPIEAIFQKKIFWKFQKIKKEILLMQNPLEKLEMNRKNWFFQENHTFSTWIWILHVLSFLLRYITYVLLKIFRFSIFYL